MKDAITPVEERRLAIQATLDAAKTQAERNRMGQFATPSALAFDILARAADILDPEKKVRFFDPAIGTGSFYSALLRAFPSERIEAAAGYEIDPHYGRPCAELWAASGLKVHIGDFTHAAPPEGRDRFNLLVCNPPYVRHHHIVNDEKLRIQHQTRQACGVPISGLSGLYCYFLGLAHAWLAEGGLAAWLIPSEFMDVNYGRAVKRYLLDRVTLLHIHRFDPADVQFGDALVSSAVVWFRNTPPPSDHAVRFTFGGSLSAPHLSRQVTAETLRHELKWTRFPAAAPREASDAPTLAEFFTIRRGLATGDNNYFILTPEEIERRGLPLEAFRPILPSPRYVDVDEIPADRHGNPILGKRLFLLDCHLSESDVKARFPKLWRYFEEGKTRSVASRYLCKHRSPWYAQENRPAAPIVCTYLGRADTRGGKPFRFILNHSKATVANVYLALYPKPPLAQAMEADSGVARKVWTILNAICPATMLGEGRVYGGGLHKLEPGELANVPVPEIAALVPPVAIRQRQGKLFASANAGGSKVELNAERLGRAS